ncbi:MAG: serine/threonine protein kinase [Labilithrix sp.]|nr:serine/threonine protein kinase [Labilithrix sp.]
MHDDVQGAERPIAPGDVIAGKYRVENVLGFGGMGRVLGARHLTLDERVAIKVLLPEALNDADAIARFLREARASVRIKGEHVARVLDVGSLDDGTPYIAMEYLEGADLGAFVSRGELFPVHTAIDYVLQACEALAEAHALGIIHRDVKPSNLFLTKGVDGTPCIKVLDFGISKATSAIDATRPDFGLTETHAVLGSPQYMAPEQMRSSRRVDARTDIWALGTILHELLTGHAPFEAQAAPELFAMILQDPAPRLRARRPDVPEPLDAIVLRCLEKDPAARPSSVAELARLLAPFGSALSAGAAERVARVGLNVMQGSGGHVPQPPSASAALAVAKTTHQSGVDRPNATSRRTVAIAAAGAALAIGATAAVVALRSPPAELHLRSATAPGSTSAPADLPPTLDLPPPPVTGSPEESAPAPSASTAARTAADARPRTPSGRASASATAAASAPPAPPPAPPPATTTAPASTASSRYD